MSTIRQAYIALHIKTLTRRAAQQARQGPNRKHKMLQANILISVLNTEIHLGLIVRIFG